MKVSLDGKRAFISAGGAGMGRSTAIAMHKLGAQVFTCDIDHVALSTLPVGITTFQCDVSDSAAVNAMFDQILPSGLDILVNNAGISGPTKLVEDISDQEWRECMSVCIDSQFYCVRRVAPIFKEQRSGSIINIVSAAGILGYPTRTPYSSAKWAVRGFTETLAMELGPSNIRVNGIVPGNVEGDRIERVIEAQAKADKVETEQIRRMYSIGTSMQCYVDAQEIADLICYITSDYGRHISGQMIAVDGNTETLYPRS
ncbi:MAG: NAD(P)-dependent dehydrogenase (short-subunit alcohol dehydrogenase family) [Arenicella sp.]|jgi:NAD(P)-dependent dehydrogenase (short-subunit alcohol dehydrogenase family)